MEKCESHNYLPQDAANIRKDVFMEEQGFFNEFDEIDKSATHIIMYENQNPVATCRIYYCKSHKCYSIGRIAVAKMYRGKQYGAKILSYAEKEIAKIADSQQPAVIGLSAQKQAVGFYEKQGYHTAGNFYSDENCLHIRMEKVIFPSRRESSQISVDDFYNNV